MARLQYHMPVAAMLLVQFIYAGLSLSTRVALLQGLSPPVFVLYRQAIATTVLAPAAYFSRRKSASCSLTLRSFTLLFLSSFIGVTLNQNAYFEGLHRASSSIATAMGNLVPAITFIIAVFAGMERVNLRSSRSVAKIAGTLMCVSGAVSIALLKGPKLLNSYLLLPEPVMESGDDQNWLLGWISLFASCFLWAIWLILQVPTTASHPDHLSSSAWLCFMATLQSTAVTLVMERDPQTWKLHSVLELCCCLYSGVMGSAVTFFLQAWCISRRGPLFSAMFNPLCTVIVTVFAALFLHEEIYTGSLIGAAGVIMGLYVVLWGKAGEVDDETRDLQEKDPTLTKSGGTVHDTINILEDDLLFEQNTLSN
ncbi:WAT1-related protein At4g30420-like isoform X2 [Prosopis cineraria]|uniref:WAT1-related protein At4g30420-like isoform X2 n=1 Tax=Prosopis cineraria TaxID=364024 RepID=UPI002410801F|nr:WAT1-related protein At4g30420-like isoform X2 [Prosopis cineraria]